MLTLILNKVVMIFYFIPTSLEIPLHPWFLVLILTVNCSSQSIRVITTSSEERLDLHTQRNIHFNWIIFYFVRIWYTSPVFANFLLFSFPLQILLSFPHPPSFPLSFMTSSLLLSWQPVSLFSVWEKAVIHVPATCIGMCLIHQHSSWELRFFDG